MLSRRDRVRRDGVRRHRRRVRLLAGVMVLVTGFAAAGCGVPDSGSPVVVKRVPPDGGAADAPADARVAPPVPQVNGTPEQSIEGFLLATASHAEDHHAAARLFLTDSAQRWKDEGPIRVFRYTESSSAGPNLFRLLGTQLGVIGADGAFTPETKPIDFALQMVRSEGVWRIDNPPPGVLIRDSLLSQSYQPITTYFLDPQLRRLIPDVRYVDASAPVSTRRTQAVRQLLGGPSGWLKPGARSAIPRATKLRGNVVQNGDVTVVDLSTEATLAPVSTVGAMVAQLFWTLRSTQATNLEFTVDGRQLSAATGVDTGVVAQANSAYDPNQPPPASSAYRIIDGRAAPLATDEPAAGGVAGPLAGIGQVADAAVSMDGSAAAVVRAEPPGQATLLLGGTESGTHAALTATSISQPTWGTDPTMATVAVDGDELVGVPIQGAPEPIESSALKPYLAGGNRIQSIRYAPDGVRLALVVGKDGNSRVLVGVIRPVGSRLSLVNPRTVSAGITGITDVAWLTESSLFTVGRDKRGDPQPYELAVDASTQETRGAVGLRGMPTSIAAIPRRSVLVTVGGRVMQLFRSGWASPGGPDPIVAAAVFYPG